MDGKAISGQETGLSQKFWKKSQHGAIHQAGEGPRILDKGL